VYIHVYATIPVIPSHLMCITTRALYTTPTTGIVRNVRAYNCTTIMWDAPEDDGGEVPQYRVRIYSGRNFYDTPPSERTVIATLNHWVTVDRFPSRRIMAIVKGRNSAGFSPSWSYPVVLTGKSS
jgi:hypothetical protein